MDLRSRVEFMKRGGKIDKQNKPETTCNTINIYI